MVRLISFIKEQIEKIIRFFNKPSVANTQSKKIVIKARHESLLSSVHSYESEEVPKITIHGVNQRTPIATGTNVFRTDVDVQNTILGNGITVNRQRKPGRCPLCATRGGITENPDGNLRWKCSTCDSTFN